MRVIYNRGKEEHNEERTKSLKKATELYDFESVKMLRKLSREFYFLDALLEKEVRNCHESKTNE